MNDRIKNLEVQIGHLTVIKSVAIGTLRVVTVASDLTRTFVEDLDGKIKELESCLMFEREWEERDSVPQAK